MEFLIFTHDPDYAAALHEGGVDGVIVDWEEHGKEGRQSGWDTEINAETAVHLERIRDATPGKVLCRINNLPGVRKIEAHLAAQLGADEVLTCAREFSPRSAPGWSFSRYRCVVTVHCHASSMIHWRGSPANA